VRRIKGDDVLRVVLRCPEVGSSKFCTLISTCGERLAQKKMEGSGRGLREVQCRIEDRSLLGYLIFLLIAHHFINVFVIVFILCSDE
jgi:hypothetical protein